MSAILNQNETTEEDYKPSEHMQKWTELIIQFMSAWKITEEEKEKTFQLFADYLEVVFNEGHKVGYEEGVESAFETMKELKVNIFSKEKGDYDA